MPNKRHAYCPACKREQTVSIDLSLANYGDSERIILKCAHCHANWPNLGAYTKDPKHLPTCAPPPPARRPTSARCPGCSQFAVYIHRTLEHEAEERYSCTACGREWKTLGEYQLAVALAARHEVRELVLDGLSKIKGD